jgi:hypothetical protein
MYNASKMVEKNKAKEIIIFSCNYTSESNKRLSFKKAY